MVSDIDVKAKSPSESWKVLNSMIHDKNSDRKNSTKTNFERLSTNVSESTREYVNEAKAKAHAMRYHNVELEDKGIFRRICTGLLLDYYFVFLLVRYDFRLQPEVRSR